MFRKAAKGAFGVFGAREALFAAFFAGGLPDGDMDHANARHS